MRTLHVVVCASSEDCKVSVQFSRHRDVIFLYVKKKLVHAFTSAGCLFPSAASARAVLHRPGPRLGEHQQGVGRGAAAPISHGVATQLLFRASTAAVRHRRLCWPLWGGSEEAAP